jgi:hypothetical protein
MKRAPPDSEDYATIHCAGLKEELIITDLSEIAARVIECTNFLTGNLVNISPSPIFLTVYKREIQDDLTLIDLPGQSSFDRRGKTFEFCWFIPGITRAQMEGQSPTIYHDIVSLIESCVQHETSIVLHVIPSSIDFSTSESIRICQRYDPRCMKIVFDEFESLLIDFSR